MTTSYGIRYYFTDTIEKRSGVLTQYGFVLGGGAAVAPTSSAAGTNGQIPICQTGGPPLIKTISGDASLNELGALSILNASVIGKLLTGYTSGAGTVAATDTILQAIQKLNGNDALKLPIASLGTNVQTFLGTPSSANLAAALTDETGSGAAVFGTTPTIATPVINGLPTGTGVASAATASTLASRDASGNSAFAQVTVSNLRIVSTAGLNYITYFDGSKSTYHNNNAGVHILVRNDQSTIAFTLDVEASNFTAGGYLKPGAFTVATLPAGSAGGVVWCSNLRVFDAAGAQQTAGNGTGGWVVYNGTNWKNLDAQAVTAVA